MEEGLTITVVTAGSMDARREGIVVAKDDARGGGEGDDAAAVGRRRTRLRWVVRVVRRRGRVGGRGSGAV